MEYVEAFCILHDQLLNDTSQATLATFAHATNTKALYQHLNVQDESSITTALDTILPQLRYPIRGFVSCAAISGESDACDYPADIFRRILDVNTTGTFLLARAIAREMHDANVTGSMVLIASMSGHLSNRGINTSAYNASKAAIHQLARSLAAEWGHPQNTFPGSTATSTNPNPSTEPREVYPTIRVNTLSPGHINTPLSEAARVRGLTDEWARQNMLGRISEPEEYRAPVIFLLGEGSSYMTGAVSLWLWSMVMDDWANV
jgi:NAD(P)-dependent dehydrogenase (short-subunit alcohol dehydrogenase family)